MNKRTTTPPQHSVTLETQLYRAYTYPNVRQLGFGEDEMLIHFQILYPTVITPCGYWILDCNRRKFINASWRKQYAWPSRALAVQSLLIRKRIEQDKLQQRLQLVEGSIKALEAWAEDEK